MPGIPCNEVAYLTVPDALRAIDGALRKIMIGAELGVVTARYCPAHAAFHLTSSTLLDVDALDAVARDTETELLLVLVRLVELWHLGELTGDDPEGLLDLIARAEAAFDRLDGEDDDPRIGGEIGGS
jgi:hypothetical protein